MGSMCRFPQLLLSHTNRRWAHNSIMRRPLIFRSRISLWRRSCTPPTRTHQGLSSIPVRRLVVDQFEHGVRQPSPEAFVVGEMAEELHVVGDHLIHHPLECLVALDAGVLGIRLLPGVAEGVILGDPCWDGFGDELSDVVLRLSSRCCRRGR